MLASATRPIHHHQHLHHHPRLDQEQDTPANAHSSLLRLSRRHSVPASGILAFLPPDCPPASAPLVIPPATLQDRSPALSSGNVNRHRYGHRHTRSEVYDSRTNNPTPTTPIVVVKRYTPSKQEEQRRVHRGLVRRMLKAVTGADDELWDDDEDDVQLPAIGEFEWAGILRSVEPEVSATLKAAEALSGTYQTTLQNQVDALTTTQTALYARMTETDQFAAKALKTTRTRTERLNSETVGLKGGAAVDALATATEETFTLMTSIVSTLLAIDEMLPLPERLAPDASPHKGHYPRLHGLLGGKAREMDVCFHRGTARDAGLVVSSSSSLSTPTSLRSRLQLLQLKTILPSDQGDEEQGSYFPLASQTATGVSLTHSAGKSCSPSDGRRRESDAISRSSSTAGLMGRSEASGAGWARRASALGGLFGRTSFGSSGEGKGKGGGGAQERLKMVLQAEERGRGRGRRGKGKRVVR